MARYFLIAALLAGHAFASPIVTKIVTRIERRQDTTISASTTGAAISVLCEALGDGASTVAACQTAPASTASGAALSVLCEALGDAASTESACQTDTPVATAVPDTLQSGGDATGQLGDADNEDWRYVSCQYGSLTSEFNNPSLQWNDSGSEAAWADVREAYDASTLNPKPPMGEFITDWFHAPPDMHCGNVTVDGDSCVTVNCGEGSTAVGQPVVAPAGASIVNSLVSLRTLWKSIYLGITESLAFALADVGLFVDTFSPIKKDIQNQKDVKLLLDGLQLGLVVATAPLLHVGLVRTAFVKANPNFFGTGVDITYGVIGSAMAFAKDAMDALSTLPIQNQISSWIGMTAANWRDAIGNGTYKVFADPDTLYENLKWGQMLHAGFPAGAATNVNDYKRAMFAAAMRTTWMTSSDIAYPVIVTSNGLEGTTGDCASWGIEDETQYDTGNKMSFSWDNGVQDDTRICDSASNAYWLMGVNPGYLKTLCCSSPEQGDVCDTCEFWTAKFSTLTGWDSLDGSKFGGLTKEGIALNAINGWTANSNVNGWNGGSIQPDWTDVEVVENWVTGDLAKTYGLVDIPVCSYQEIADTVVNDIDNSLGNPNYPCPLNNPLCNVPAGCTNALAPNGCAVVCS